MAEFSSRSRHIDAEKNRLIAEYVEKHGRQPSTATIIKLRAQATRTTRPEKQVRSLADLTLEWRGRAGRLLGMDATSWARGVTANETPLLLRADDIPLDVIASLGQSVVDVVGEKRSTWRRWNLTAEAARRTMGYRFASTVDREAVVGLVVDAAEAASLRLTPPELASSPVTFRRPDGTSVFRPKHSTVFSSELLLEAEDRLLDRARTTTGPTVPLAVIERIAARPDRKGHTLGDDQTAALAKIAVSGRIVDVLVGPAGAGKTTAMSALRRAWEHEHGAGSVVGLAPSAVAAQVLADDLGIATENTAKWWQNHLVHGDTFRRGQLVIVDQIADKWSMMAMAVLVHSTRFNEIRRRLQGVTQRVLTQTLRRLERNGMIQRRVLDTSPVGVEYSLTPLSESLREPFGALYDWTIANADEIRHAQQTYDERSAHTRTVSADVTRR